jgi:hypothetical protein
VPIVYLRFFKCLLAVALHADEEAAGSPAVAALSAEQELTVEKSREKFEYQAEVQRLMDIIINSL